MQALSGFLADRLIFRIGNAEPIQGKNNVIAANKAFFESIGDMSHRIDGIWSSGENIICNGFVNYKRLDGGGYSAPFAIVLTIRNNLITEYLVYADISEL